MTASTDCTCAATQRTISSSDALCWCLIYTVFSPPGLEQTHIASLLAMTTLEVLRFISVFASAIHAGSQLSLSFVSGAALLASPRTADEPTILAQFRVIFRRGFCLCPPFAAAATLASLGCALIQWRADHGALALRACLAALCTASLIPSTLMFIVRGESALLEKGAKMAQATPAAHADEKSREAKMAPCSDATTDLIRDWARLNYTRCFFPLVGAMLAYGAL